MAQSTLLDINNLDYKQKFDVGFRIVIAYHVNTDGHFARLDFKYKDKQYAVAFITTMPHKPEPGQTNFSKIMITPNKGVEACINLQTSKPELLRAFRELVSDLENS